MDSKNYSLKFKGEGKEYFSIFIVNWLLTIVTLGLYYPWAKEKVLKYMYSHMELEGTPFTFHGTGKEMFKGFIKGIVLIILIYGAALLLMRYNMIVIGTIILYFGLLAIIPLAIHGSLRYRLSRTSYRGVHFGYRGDRKVLYGKFIKGILLTLVTFGIYSFWFEMDLRKYISGHSRYGSSSFSFSGDGSKWFGINIVGILLTLVTFYIYAFKYTADRFNYLVDHTKWKSDDGEIEFKGQATGMGFFELLLVNGLLLMFTFGLAYPWVVVRTMRFYTEHIDLNGNADLEKVQQTEEQYQDAAGDEMLEIMDLDIIF